jgi:hypothetical protein
MSTSVKRLLLLSALVFPRPRPRPPALLPPLAARAVLFAPPMPRPPPRPPPPPPPRPPFFLPASFGFLSVLLPLPSDFMVVVSPPPSPGHSAADKIVSAVRLRGDVSILGDDDASLLLFTPRDDALLLNADVAVGMRIIMLDAIVVVVLSPSVCVRACECVERAHQKERR